MLIKSAQFSEGDAIALGNLLQREGLSPFTRSRIERELKTRQAGIDAERGAAYEINFEYAESKNQAVIHDLRLVVGNRVAQIDHLIINRVMEIYLCESKSATNELVINEHGEFTTFFNRMPVGIGSPIEQNRRHAQVLSSLLNSGAVDVPNRFGIPPKMLGLVLVSKKTPIKRPAKDFPGLETVIHCDQILKHVQKEPGALGVFRGAASIISSETLQRFAESLARQHRQPEERDWAAYFGLPSDVRPPAPVRVSTPRPAAPPRPAPRPLVIAGQTGDQEPRAPKTCAMCGAAVEAKVVSYCRFNKAKYGGKVYCRECQPKVVNGPPAEAIQAIPVPQCAACRCTLTTDVVRYCETHSDRFAGLLYCRRCQAPFPKRRSVMVGEAGRQAAGLGN